MQAQLPPAPLRGQAIRRRIGCPSTSMHRGHGRSGSNKEPLAALAPATAEVDILLAVRPVQTDQLLPIALDAVQQGADLFDEGCPLSDVGAVEELLGILSRQAQSAQGGAAASCWAAQTSAPRAAAMSGQKGSGNRRADTAAPRGLSRIALQPAHYSLRVAIDTGCEHARLSGPGNADPRTPVPTLIINP